MLAIAALCALSGALALSGDIAFVDAAAGDGGAVCLLDIESGAVRQLGPGRHDGPPRWSPDGVWLAFESAEPGGRGLYVVRADGSGGRAAGSGVWRTAPAWSCDGTRLAYVGAAEPGVPGQVRVVDLNTGEDAAWANGAPGIVQPVWVPFTLLMKALDPDQSMEVPGVDMRRLRQEARMRDLDLGVKALPDALLGLHLIPERLGNHPAVRTDIVMVTRSEVLPLFALADPDRGPSSAVLLAPTPNWIKFRHAFDAPSGKTFGAYPFDRPGETTRIAFESNEGGDREIYVLGRRGIANVTNHRAADWNPVWAPDGNNLAFESFRGGSRGIYNAYADTAHVTPIVVEAGANCWSPAWSPDGARLVYVSDRSGQAELYETASEEGDPVQLTDTGGPKAAPAWRPVHP